jgi:hypothetical protein
MDNTSLRAFIFKLKSLPQYLGALNNISIVVMMPILRQFYVQLTGVLNGKSHGYTKHVALQALCDILVPTSTYWSYRIA